MHLSLLLLIASFQATGQAQNPSDNQANPTQVPSSQIVGSDQKPELSASRIPHFRSALKAPSKQTTEPQAPASKSQASKSPPVNSFVPPATQNFSPIESSGFNPVNPNATSPLRNATNNMAKSNTSNGAFLKNSPSETNSSPPPSSILPPNSQRNATQIDTTQSATTQSPAFSPNNTVPKGPGTNAPATGTQQQSIPRGGGTPLTQPSGSYPNQEKTTDAASSLRRSRSITSDPNNSSNPLANGTRPINSETSDAVNSSPTIEPRGMSGGITQRDRGSGTPNNAGQPSQTQTPPTQEQKLDTTYDPQLKQIAESILRSNPRGEKNRVGLADVVQIARNTSQRKQIVREYWTGFVNQADADFAAQERNVLQQLSKPNNRFEQTLIRAAIRSSEARLAEANLEMAKSNAKLYAYVPSLAKGQELVFADLPWVGRYKTNANQLVSTGRFASKILNVDKALVGVRDLIQLRAASVYENMTALQEAISEYQNGRVQLSVVVMLHKEVRDQRIAFLTSVRDYNIAIADYAITAYPNAVDPLLVAGMLVDTKKTLPKIDLVADRQIRQASGIQNLSPGNNDFRGNADPVVRQAGGF